MSKNEEMNKNNPEYEFATTTPYKTTTTASMGTLPVVPKQTSNSSQKFGVQYVPSPQKNTTLVNYYSGIFNTYAQGAKKVVKNALALPPSGPVIQTTGYSVRPQQQLQGSNQREMAESRVKLRKQEGFEILKKAYKENRALTVDEKKRLAQIALMMTTEDRNILGGVEIPYKDYFEGFSTINGPIKETVESLGLEKVLQGGKRKSRRSSKKSRKARRSSRRV